MLLKTAISHRLRAYPRLFRPLRRAYLRAQHWLNPLHAQIGRTLARRKAVFFVQVGSNDGAQGDPINKLVNRHPHWRGIFVEPVPFLFERLKSNYPGSGRFVFENVAIAKVRGKTQFYYVSEHAKAALGDRLPYWYDQLGSFNRNHIIKHLDGLLEPFIVDVELPCVPLQEILDRNSVMQIDLLHIDTEGYDYEVLSQFDFARYRPAVVLYEHKHLKPAERGAAHQLLMKQGYRLQVRGDDTLATR